jgi:transcriptional regulator of aromatic amino acid metabolism
VGLVRDISTIVAEDKVNITSMNVTEHEDHTVTITLTVQTTGITQLSRLMSRIEGIGGVVSVNRMDGDGSRRVRPSTKHEIETRNQILNSNFQQLKSHCLCRAKRNNQQIVINTPFPVFAPSR